MNLETAFVGLSVVAELLVAFVIWYEWEGGRLDNFLADADGLADERTEIYRAYCGLSDSTTPSMSERFKEKLEELNTQELRDACHKNIRLVSRMGSRLPRIWWMRKTPLDWHVPVMLWMILGPYVKERRKETSASYAQSFLEYAYVSSKRLLKQNRDTWVLRDPDRSRKRDVGISRDELIKLQADIKHSLKI